MRQIGLVLGCIVLCAQAYSQVNGRDIHPSDPVEEAKRARASELIDQAKQLVRSNDDTGAIGKLREAAEVEATLSHGFQANGQYYLARMYVKQGRILDALAAYQASFIWRPEGFYGDTWRGDLEFGFGSIHNTMEYAVLLARQGRREDAKAMYYFGLRASAMALPTSRSREPTPFLVVFDPEPEGIYWEYTPERLEAAACMLQAMLSDGVRDFATNTWTSRSQFIERARSLAPDWFYPVLYLANQKNLDSPAREQLTAQAEALAKPGLERQLMQRFRQDIAELLVINEQNDTPGAGDGRPLTEGAERRRRMQCLRPNETILRRLSIEGPR